MVKHGALQGLYRIEKTIGCGGFAKVKLATHLATGEKVAVKIMDKSLLGDDLHRVKLELQALKSVQHKNICQLYQVIETESHFFLVMEYCSGGELFDHIVEKNRLSEHHSRMFFRQIVSAVAYLHSLGYAHRDLKPENILLDQHQHLKLIDFGLCAKPEGGMENPLFTSCGSPTYAAPELILGQQYLGQEVDVWAMGVLLYVLLVGNLPFDDCSIDNLYRKILNGNYEEPSFISRESRKLIKSMLQVDPKRRIKISQLLNHPWLTLGILEPVNLHSHNKLVLDKECVQIMANFMDVDENSMRTELAKWKYDYNTVTYFLLLHRKTLGLNVKLYPIGRLGLNNPIKKITTPLLEVPDNNVASPTSHNGKAARKFGKAIKSPRCLSPNSTARSKAVLEPDESATRRAVKRRRSPINYEASPVPTKKQPPAIDFSPATTATPERRKLPSSTSGSTRKVLGSIERSLHRVRHALTPKKSTDGGVVTPIVLSGKDLCNVSMTQCKDPEIVIVELTKSLERKGIACVRKGFRLKGSLEPNILSRFGGCSFELEVCYLPNLGLNGSPTLATTPTKSILKHGSNKAENERHFVGIRRKRLKGDSWCYKKVCEQVLIVTASGFNTAAKEGIVESAV